jgi:PAS domain S-box-containing protein
MPRPLKVLIVEDNPADAELLVRELRRAGFEPEWKRVDTEAAYLEHLHDGLDLVLSDYQMPQFSGLRALELLNQSGLEVPLIIVSGTIGEDTAVAAMKQGAADYLIKDRLTRLGSAINHALESGRLRAEGRSNAAQLRLQGAALATAANAIIITDPKGLILWSNPAFTTLTGYTAAEAAGQTPRLLKSGQHDATFYRKLWETILSGRVWRGEFINRRKDGSLYHGEQTITPVRGEAGAITHFIGVMNDVTARKRAEEESRETHKRLQELLEYSPAVLYALKLEGEKIVPYMVSENMTRLLGFTVAESLSHEWWLGQLHPDDRERAVASIAETITNDTSRTEYRLRHKDGSYRWVDDNRRLVRNSANAPAELVGIWADITERRVLEEQLRQAQKMEAIGTLAGGIAHDFNNILAAILGYTQLSQMVLKENPEVRGYLNAILQATSRATHLVRQILTFSRQQPPERQMIELQPVVEETFDLLRATIPSTIDFDLSLASDIPTVLADTTQIHQILMNLGTNAWHAMKDRPGRLQVKLEKCLVDATLAATQPQLKPGLYARVSVSDTGCGMEPATLRRIFEPFFTTKAPGEGTGLGLAVVHGIMKDHDGAITVCSQPGEGTTFDLYFPTYASKPPAAAVEQRPVPRGHGERILFVDDEEVLVQLGQETLTELGYEVEVATEPAVALAMVRADPQYFALVITDQTMPEMTGLVLAGQLLKIRPKLPIIITTGYSAVLTAEQIEAVGIRQLLFKPITVQSLGTAVHTVLSVKSTARILLIDDDDSFRTMLRLTLAHFGYTMIEARNGKEGLARFKEANADLVITDIVMPEKEGFEVLMELRTKQVPPVKIIAISGGGRVSAADNLRMAKLLGAAKVLAKPFSNEVLIAAINELLPGSKASIQPPMAK